MEKFWLKAAKILVKFSSLPCTGTSSPHHHTGSSNAPEPFLEEQLSIFQRSCKKYGWGGFGGVHIVCR